MSYYSKKTNIQQGIFLAICFVCTTGAPVEAASAKQSVNEGNRLYDQGDYAASEGKYMEALIKDPESDVINFDLGTALYKNRDYEQAIDHFQKVFLSDDEGLKQKSYYNLGNTLYKLGMEQEKKNDIVFAVSSLEKALNQYQRALSIDQEDEDTKHNFDFVQKELKRLQEIEKQQQQQGQGDQSEQSQQQQQQSQNEQSQNQQNKQDQQQSESDQENQQAQGDQQQDQDQQQSEQANGQSGDEEEKSQQKAGASQQSESELTEQEARMLLESYQQTEEPQGPLNMQKRKVSSRPVTKDW